MNNIKQFIFALTLSVLMYACSTASGDTTGQEYMPDMGHSLAVEANTYNYYYYNTWDEESTIPLWELVKNPGEPVKGTIPRGYAGGTLGAAADLDVILGNDQLVGIRITPNGSAPYYYEDTEDSRTLATSEIIDNPFPITAAGLARGKDLYNVYCGICHGIKADGLGYLYDSDTNKNAKYLAAPADFLKEEFMDASNGRFYHAIMYGKNVMGGYADKLSQEERWQVIHYIRSLQAKKAEATYNEAENTFNAVFGMPMADVEAISHEHMDDMAEDEMHLEGEHQTDAH